jgi:hypothetical protein
MVFCHFCHEIYCALPSRFRLQFSGLSGKPLVVVISGDGYGSSLTFASAGMFIAPACPLNQHFQTIRGRTAMAWNLLFTSDIGLLSLFTILFILVMAVYIGYYAMKQVNKEAASRGGQSQPGAH